MMMEAEAAAPGMEQQHHDQHDMQGEEGEEELMVSTSRFLSFTTGRVWCGVEQSMLSNYSL